MLPVDASQQGSGAVGQGTRPVSSPAEAAARPSPMGRSTGQISMPFVAREILPTVAIISASGGKPAACQQTRIVTVVATGSRGPGQGAAERSPRRSRIAGAGRFPGASEERRQVMFLT